jgi:5-methylcytosine-specific restriction endonuclease McrA
MRNPEYRQATRDAINEWRRNNPLSQQELTLRRNARKKAATTERVSYKRILERDGYHCYICEQPIDSSIKGRVPGALSFDHIIPLQPREGEPQGTHSEDNIKPAHVACNARKINKPLESLTPFERRGPDN